MAGPWEKYQQQAPAEAQAEPPVEAPQAASPEAVQPVEAAPTEAPAPAAPVAAEGPWTKYATAPKAGEKAPISEPVDDGAKRWAEEHPIAGRALAALTGVSDVMPFRKDIQAGIHALTDFGEGSLEEKFSRAKKAQSRAQKALTEAYPVTSLAGQIAPFVAAPELALTAPESALATKLAPYIGGIGSRMAASGAAGAGMGAVYGAGEGEGLKERGENVIRGAGLGLLGGAAAPAVTAGGKRAFEALKDYAPYFGFGAKEAAERRVAKDWPEITGVARKLKSGMTPEELANAEKYGEEIYPIDVLGTPGAAMAKTVSALSPEAKAIIETPLVERNRNQQKMFSNFLAENVMNKPGIDIFSSEGKDAIRAEAQSYVPEQYKIAFESPESQNVISEDLSNILNYSSIQKAIPKAIEAYEDILLQKSKNLPPEMRLEAYNRFTNPFVKNEQGKYVIDVNKLTGENKQIPLELWDKIKRQVQSKAETFKPSPFNSKSNAGEYARLSGQAADLTKSLKDLNLPGYNEALTGAGKYLGEESAWNLGAKFAGMSDPQKINDVTKTVSRLKPEEKEYFAHSYLQNMSDKILGAFKERNIGTMLNERTKRKDIIALGEDRANMIHKFLERADKANKSLSALGGSDTANKLVGLIKQMTVGHGAGAGAGLGLATDLITEFSETGTINPSNLIKSAVMGGLAGAAAKRGFSGKAAVDEQYAKQIAEKLISKDPNSVAEAMRIVNNVPELKQAITKADIIMQQLSGSRGARQERASGGKVGKRDYPAKRLTRLEKAAQRAHNEIAHETKPLLDQPDEQIAHALEIASKTPGVL